MESPAMTEVMSNNNNNNNELLTEILIRIVPLKSILAVRSVCKSWETLISSPLFSHAYHHRNHKHNPHPFTPFTFLLRRAHSFTSYQLFSLSHIDHDHDGHHSSLSVSLPFDLRCRILIDQSINGLLLCRNYRTLDDAHPLHDWRRFVYNPTTNRIRHIPNPLRDCHDDHYMWAFHLAFDPSKSPFYKLLCVGSQPQPEPEPGNTQPASASASASFFIRIYHSKTARFDPEQYFEFNASRCLIYNQGVYWRNAINWVLVEHGASHSLYFDVDQDLLGTMPSPPGVTVDGRCTVLKDELIYLDVYIANDSQFKIYALSSRDDEMGWSLRYTITDYLHSVVCLAYNNERDRIYMLVQDQEAYILAYDVVAQVFDHEYRFDVPHKDCWRNQWHPVFSHTPSLASV